jgi:hypothetical protein
MSASISANNKEHGDQLKEVHEKIELLKRMNRIFSNCLVALSEDHLREASQKDNAIDEF